MNENVLIVTNGSRGFIYKVHARIGDLLSPRSSGCMVSREQKKQILFNLSYKLP